MKLKNRIELLQRLKQYLLDDNEEWQAAKRMAYQKNNWFVEDFTSLAVKNIVEQLLDENLLAKWVEHYRLDDNITAKNVGVVMAGNIPLVGFQDFLAVFVSGHEQTIKLSSKDDVLLRFLVGKMIEWDKEVAQVTSFSELLKGCDAYIATGSNNTARYFDYYFAKYPSVIRKNRTSVALLTGNETKEELEKLADDIHSYFGLGCRNVTQLYVPDGYDFVPLIDSFHKYAWFSDHNKYRNNYDYNLSLFIMNNQYYMTGDTVLLVESDKLFAPISQLNYSFYSDKQTIIDQLKTSTDIQCIVGYDIPLGEAQKPGLFDYADGIDTMQFLLTL